MWHRKSSQPYMDTVHKHKLQNEPTPDKYFENNAG